MAIKKKESLDAEPLRAATPRKQSARMLTPEEGESLLRALSAPPAPLSPEIKRAIANYKRVKAERLE